MGWWSKKKDADNSKRGDDDDNDGNHMGALVRQDSHTRVRTTIAAAQTTNTAVQNATIVNRNTNTITYQTTRQTVTHTQQARMTEMITRRKPSELEIEAMLAQIKIDGGTASSRTTNSSTTRMRPNNFNGLSARSMPSFKHTNGTAGSPLSPLGSKFESTIPPAGGKRNSSLLTIEQTTMSQKNGSRITEHVETQRVPLKTTWPPPRAAPTKTTATTSTTTTSTPYVSPYANQRAIGGIARTTTATATATPKPYVSSVSSSTGAIPKRSTSNACDAQLTFKPNPFIGPNPPAVPPVVNSKLKPAHVCIFNHVEFDTKNENRTGSNVDVQSLERTFKKYNCKVEVITNATTSIVRRTVGKLERYNFEKHSALVIVVLSHGTRREGIAAKDGVYSLDDEVLFPILRNRTLNNKPKLLFVQACKGDMERGGFQTDAVQPLGSPNEIMKCYSTFEGYVSYRSNDGSIFIKTLCTRLQELGQFSDIEKIMAEVRLSVKNLTQDAQIPSVTSTLTTKYIFGDYAKNS